MPDARRRLLVLDVDSTLITAEVIELLAVRAGAREEVAAITDRAMRGEIDFTRSLHERVATLAGLSARVFDDVLAEIRLAPGADALLAAARERGWVVGLVSGGFLEVVGPLAARLGLDPAYVRANRLEVAAGRLTGRVLGEVVDRVAKARALREYAAAAGIDLADTVAVGDGANDLDMLAAAGLGVAYDAKPVVVAAADAHIEGRLDALLDLPQLADG